MLVLVEVISASRAIQVRETGYCDTSVSLANEV